MEEQIATNGPEVHGATDKGCELWRPACPPNAASPAFAVGGDLAGSVGQGVLPADELPDAAANKR